MARHAMRKYIGIFFMIVVIAPAVILSLLAIRAIGHEEAYIEKQLEGTLSAEVTHISSVVAAEVGRIHDEVEAAAPPGLEGVPAGFEQWMQRSTLVEVPFLLSADHEILWPAATTQAAADEVAGEMRRDRPKAVAQEATEKEASFVEEQEAFFSDEEEIPVYENIAVAFVDEILGDAVEIEEPTAAAEASRVAAAPSSEPREKDQYGGIAAEKGAAADTDITTDRDGTSAERYYFSRQATKPAEQSRRQAAITEFQQSEEVRRSVWDKAELEGQQLTYRNVAPGQRGGSADLEDLKEKEPVAEKRVSVSEEGPADKVSAPAQPEKKRDERRDVAAESPDAGAIIVGMEAPPEYAGRIRSIFISQPLRFSEIVAEHRSGLIPRTIDGRLHHLYWQRLDDGRIFGCLIDAQEFRERIVGALTNIYSDVRILTVLDEKGTPLITPRGQGDRDWRRPFVAQEISELLPRWESVAYLTRPDAITSRARATTTVMWILILILFVSILAGSVLVLRSAYAEVRLARQRTSFVANVSHELKTPLTSIRMFAEMLRDGRQADPDKQKHYLDIMTAEAERLTRLINNVLDFSRMERGEKRYTMGRCDLVVLTREVVESQRARLENNGFEVILSRRAGELEVDADREAIKQALVNLLSNAEKYSPETREIEIDVGECEGSAVVSVADRGVGIPPGEVENVFDEFYRVDDALTSEVKGAGLGLTIASKILKDHNGAIRYTPREGGGSRFDIVLPLAAEPEHGRRQEER